MSSSETTIVLIHGCFATPACFNRLIPHLEKAGYPTLSATYPSSNPVSPSGASAQTDVDHMRTEYIAPLVEKEHRTILLVVHSYGGVVGGGGAACGFSTTDRRAKGMEGGVLGMVYIAGNIVHGGQTLLASAGGQWPDWFAKDTPRPGLALISPLLPTLYNDMDVTSGSALESELTNGMVPQTYACLETPAPEQAWAENGFVGRLGYVRTELDLMNPAWAQDVWMEGSGVEWEVVRMESGHAPFVSRVEELAGYVVGFAEKFEAL